MQIVDELGRVGNDRGWPEFVLQYACKLQHYSPAGRNAGALTQMGVMGGADGTWLDMSDDRDGAGSGDPAYGIW
jgi:hypothetical protein